MGTSEQYCPPQPPMIESTLALNPNASSNAFNTTTTSAEYPAKVDFYLAEIYPLVREIYDEMTWNVFPGIIRRGMNALAFAEHGYNSSGFEKNPSRNYDIVGLVTFPNSGTTWMQQMVTLVTGVVSESIYPTGGNKTVRGTYFEQLEGRERRGFEPAFVKTHWPFHLFSPQFAEWDRYVRLVRNPIDNVYARYRYEKKIWKALNWSMQYYQIELIRWVQWHKYWNSKTSVPVLIVEYEDLTQYPMWNLRKVLNFLGYPAQTASIRNAINLKPSIHPYSPLPIYLDQYSMEQLIAFRDILNFTRNWQYPSSDFHPPLFKDYRRLSELLNGVPLVCKNCMGNAEQIYRSQQPFSKPKR